MDPLIVSVIVVAMVANFERSSLLGNRVATILGVAALLIGTSGFVMYRLWIKERKNVAKACLLLTIRVRSQDAPQRNKD